MCGQTIRSSAAAAAENHRPRHRRGKPPEEFVINNFALDGKIKEAMTDLSASVQWSLMEFSDEDKELIADFILHWPDYGNGRPMPPNTKKGYVNALHLLSEYVIQKRNGGKYKALREFTSDDFFAREEPKGYLQSLKPERALNQEGQTKKWMNTYNTRGSKYLAFWRWWTNMGVVPKEEWRTPPQLKGYRAVTPPKTNVRREDHWTEEEHRVFFQYCDDLRIKCFHAIHRDVGGRPGDLLQMKLDDIKPEPNKKSCRFWIGEKGKTEYSYHEVTVTEAIPFFNEWAHVHPRHDWPVESHKKVYLFPRLDNKGKYHNEPIKPDRMRQCYVEIIKKKLPRRLDDPNISARDKTALRSLIYERKHNPYLRRHEWSTKMAFLPPKVHNRLMGLSQNSDKWKVYQQIRDEDAVIELEIARGVRTREDTVSATQLELQPKSCWFCGELNKHAAKFCLKCSHALNQEGAIEQMQKEAEAQKDTEDMKKRIEELTRTQQIILKNLGDMAKTEEWYMDDPIVTFENTLRRMLGKRDKHGNYKHNLPEIEAAIARIKEGDKHIEEEMFSAEPPWHKKDRND